MASDKYDDLDDLLDDEEFQTSIINNTPGSGAKSSSDSTTESSKPTSNDSKKPTEDSGKNQPVTLEDLLKQLELDQSTINDLHEEFPNAGWSKKEQDKTNSAGDDSSNLQNTVFQTANRMKKNRSNAEKTDSNSFDEATIMKQLLDDLSNEDVEGSSMFESLLGGGEGADSMISSLLSVLASKEVLYEPMKQLHTRYPDWLENNSSTLNADDLARYKKQQEIVKIIVEKFEEPGYSDSNESDSFFISEKMAEMQETGTVPADLVDEGNISDAAQESCDTQ